MVLVSVQYAPFKTYGIPPKDLSQDEVFWNLRKEAGRRGGDAVIEVSYSEETPPESRSGPYGAYTGWVVVWTDER